MAAKDIITMLVSALALVISVIATTISIIRGKYEQQRAVRNQITEVLKSMIAVQLDNAKLYHDAAEKEPGYFQAVSNILSQQNGFLLQQAVYLMDQVPHLVTAVEYNTVAFAHAEAGDLIQAERYFTKAIEVCPNDYARSGALRSYGTFLFAQHRHEEGREQFRRAIPLLKGADNFARAARGIAYQTWAWNELHNATSPKRAEELFESAKSEFSGIDNEGVRRDLLRGLEAAEVRPQSMPASPPSMPH